MNNVVLDHGGFVDGSGWGDQQEDHRNAITWLQLQSQIDPERIGVWGFSFSGGHVLQVAAFDCCIKCVVAQVPAPVETQFSRRGHDRP